MKEYKPDILDRWTDSIENKIKGVAKNHALRSLEKEIAKALVIIDGHKKSGVPSGDLRYQSVVNVLYDKIEAFCGRFDVPESDIEAQIPGLALAKQMTTPAPVRSKAGIFALAIIGIAVLLTLIGVAIGYIQMIAHSIAR